MSADSLILQDRDNQMITHRIVAAHLCASLLAGAALADDARTTSNAKEPLPGMPPVVDTSNLYSETTPSHLSSALAGALPRVYVPNHSSDDVLRVQAHFEAVNHLEARGIDDEDILGGESPGLRVVDSG